MMCRCGLTACLGLAAALASSAVAGCPETAADAVLGQVDFIGNWPNQPDGWPTAAGLALSNAAAVAVSPRGRLYVSDSDNHRVLSWASAARFANGDPADLVLGQPDFTSNDPNHGGVSGHSLYLPQGLFVDGAGDLWVADAFNHRVLKFNDPMNDATPVDADLVIGQVDLFHNQENLGLGGHGPDVALPDSLQFPGRVLTTETHVFVADSGNSRVLRYPYPTEDKPLADVVYGQYGNLYCRAKNNNGTCENGFGVTAENMKNPVGIALEADGRLYIADWPNNRVLRFDPPLTDTVADAVYGQPGFSSATYNNGGPAVGLGLPIDLVMDGRGWLFVADSGNNRVLAYAAPLESATPTCVFGQYGDLDETDINHGLGPFEADAEALFGATGVAVDAAGNLYVADTNNNRALRFVRGCGLGDMTADGWIDAVDAAVWLAALVGPEVLTPPAGVPAAEFACADLDGDGDVDLSDAARFQAAFGAGG